MGGVLLGAMPLQAVFFIFALPAVCGAFFVVGLSQVRRFTAPAAAVKARA
jgi:hypothetical protein